MADERAATEAQNGAHQPEAPLTEKRCVVQIDYTNWRGERGLRQIIPISIRFGCNEWHLRPQWLLNAIDQDKRAVREFAFCEIHSWAPLSDVVGERLSLEAIKEESQ